MSEGVSTFAGEEGSCCWVGGWGSAIRIGRFVLLSIGGKTDDSELGWIKWRWVE